jgi:hypothetical protein
MDTRRGAPALRPALEPLLALDANTGEARRWLPVGGRANTLSAMELWDFGPGYALTVGQVQVARHTGALVQLRLAIQPVMLIHSS